MSSTLTTGKGSLGQVSTTNLTANESPPQIITVLNELFLSKKSLNSNEPQSSESFHVQERFQHYQVHQRWLEGKLAISVQITTFQPFLLEAG